MKRLEVRRHSLTKKGSDRGSGSALSDEGIALARGIGEGIGPFDLVIATPIDRTVETAIAMGFAVGEIVDAGLDDAFWEEIGRHDHWTWTDPFGVYRQVVAEGKAVARVAHAQRSAWLDALDRVPDGGGVLAISHGHAIECGLVACTDASITDGGRGPFNQCEGFRCAFDDGRFADIEILRLT